MTFKTGEMFLTKGGWLAVWCLYNTVFHNLNGGQLYTHNDSNGEVKSGSVGSEYDLEYRVTQI